MTGFPKCCDEDCTTEDCDGIDGVKFTFIGADDSEDEIALPFTMPSVEYINTEVVDTTSMELDASHYLYKRYYGRPNFIDNIMQPCPPKSFGIGLPPSGFNLCNAYYDDWLRYLVQWASSATWTCVTKRITSLSATKSGGYITASGSRTIRFEYTLSAIASRSIKYEQYTYRPQLAGIIDEGNADPQYWTEKLCGSISPYPLVDYPWGVPCHYEGYGPYDIGCYNVDNEVLIQESEASAEVTKTAAYGYQCAISKTICCEPGFKTFKSFKPNHIGAINYGLGGVSPATKYTVQAPMCPVVIAGSFAPQNCEFAPVNPGPNPAPQEYPDLTCQIQIPKTCTTTYAAPYLPATVYLTNILDTLQYGRPSYYDRTFYNVRDRVVCQDTSTTIGSAHDDIRMIEMELY
jgi:hypothetical protein